MVKFFPLVWAGIWRKRAHTIFTLVSVATAFSLFGLLQAVNHSLDSLVHGAPLGRLVTIAPDFSALPISYLPQIEAVPGVTKVAFVPRFGGYWRDAKNPVWPNAVDPATYMAVYPEFKLPPEQLDAWIHTRTGGVVGADMAKRYGWKIGDRVPVHSISTQQVNGSSDWQFDIVGIWEDPGIPARADGLLINWNYYNEARAPAPDTIVAKDTVVVFIEMIQDPTKARQISNTIDHLFANSPAETKTDSEQTLIEGQLRLIGDVRFIMDAIVSAVFFTLLLLLGVDMAHSVQERTPEFAVLKAVGYPDASVLAIVLAEGSLLCLSGAGVGLAAAVVAYPWAMRAMGIAGFATFSYIVIPVGIMVAALVGVVSGLVPAWRAKDLTVIDGLSRAGR